MSKVKSRSWHIDLFSVTVIFLLGMLVGRYTWPVHLPENYTALSSEEIQDGLDVYTMCMQSASRTGCRMSVENFTVYHGLKREQKQRALERARLAAEYEKARQAEQ